MKLEPGMIYKVKLLRYVSPTDYDIFMKRLEYVGNANYHIFVDKSGHEICVHEKDIIQEIIR